MVSQFISPDPVRLLGELDFEFPEGTHAIGRLDGDSEGLLLLTTNKKITNLLFNGPVGHDRAYLVQVRGLVTEETIDRLRNGIPIIVEGGVFYTTNPCKVELVDIPESKYAELPREKEYVQYSWLLITLQQGKFRQVRKMAFAAGHRVKRLIRVSIEDMTIGDMKPGEIKEISEVEFFSKLKL